MVKVLLTEAQLRRIIHEEVVDHYLTQKELWDDTKDVDRPLKRSDLLNKGRRQA